MKEVTDIRSNCREQILHAVEIINNSKNRLRVFEEIYRGKSPIKTVEYIASKSGLEPKRVLEIGLVFFNNQLIDRKKINGKYALIKDPFFSQHKAEIIRLVKNKPAREKFYTKWNPKSSPSTVVINLPVTKKDVCIEHITIDDTDSFQKVTEVEFAPESENQQMLEETFQTGAPKNSWRKGRIS